MRRQATVTRLARARPPRLSWPPGGILVSCGPPLDGKGPLAARLCDALPNAIKLETVDDLSNRPRASERELLEQARAIWTARLTDEPVVLVCERFGTPSARKRAALAAREIGARFLLVETMSAPIRSIRRFSRLLLRPQQIAERIGRYQREKPSYVPLHAAERARLPGITVRRALADIDLAVLRVVEAWRPR